MKQSTPIIYAFKFQTELIDLLPAMVIDTLRDKKYLTFSVEISTNTLITQYSKHLWSDEQEHTHNRIKSLHDSGKCYRTIAKLLNAEGSRTAKNNEWKNSNVHSVLKRYAERQARLERQSYTSEMKFSKMKLEWFKD